MSLDCTVPVIRVHVYALVTVYCGVVVNKVAFRGGVTVCGQVNDFGI